MADPVILPIALMATLACWSGTRIGRARQSVGRGRADAAATLAARQSAAASFHGNTLFFLLLLALLELAGTSSWLLAAASIAFIASRGLLIAAVVRAHAPACRYRDAVRTSGPDRHRDHAGNQRPLRPLAVWSRHLMVHHLRESGRMRYGPGSTWERPHDSGVPRIKSGAGWRYNIV